jgi:hypothetical protein
LHGRFERFQAAVRFKHLVALQFQVHADKTDHSGFVIDDQDALAVSVASPWGFCGHGC